MKKSNILSWFITFSFLILLGWYSVSNYEAVSKPLKKFLHTRSDISSFSRNINQALKSDNLFLKDEFININGLYGRLSGRRLYNEVVLLNNGMLTSVQEYMKDIGRPTEALPEFHQFLKEHGARFLFAQFPFKIDMEGRTAPQGLEFSGPKDIESTLQKFRSLGIDVIDTLPELSQTAADIEENFYRTDHHWKPSGAFKAFQIIMKRIAELYPEEEFPQQILDITGWTVHEIPEQFLGSRGKRVGKYFGGLDSLQWMTPDFETELSMYIPQQNKFVKGTYEEVFIQKEYLEKGLNLLHTNHYSVYFGKDYPLVQIRNHKAPSSLKLFVIKDSYALPLVTFLSTVFRELDMIDPRYYGGSSIQEYIDRTHPDLVLMATYTALGTESLKFYDFTTGGEKYLDGSESVLAEKDVVIGGSGNSSAPVVFFDNFENESCYTLYIPKITLTAGESDAVSAVLYNEKTDKIVSETVFDIGYCSTFGNCFRTFQTPESGSENLRLLLYAGIREQDENAEIAYSHVRLVKNGIRNDRSSQPDNE